MTEHAETPLILQLNSLADEAYRQFSLRLLPGVPPETVIGVRLPQLRKLAKGIAQEDPELFFQTVTDETFEERLLQGLVISSLKLPYDQLIDRVRQFIPKIDTWSICDSFCSGLTIAKKYPRETWEFILPYVHHEAEYSARFGLVMMLAHYVQPEWLDAALEQLARFHSPHYYANMAAAWTAAAYFSKFPQQTFDFLEDCGWDDWTRNKALQKILESRTTSDEYKAAVRALKR